MIERHRKGIAKVEEADHYIEHLLSDTFPKLSAMDGFIRASILKKDTDKGIEFLIVTVWKSLAAIKQFGGEVS
jgi:heme-degrading monooxygenase HmoA